MGSDGMLCNLKWNQWDNILKKVDLSVGESAVVLSVHKGEGKVEQKNK